MTSFKRLRNGFKTTTRRSSPPSSDEEFDMEVEVLKNPFEKLPIRIDKNIDFSEFTLKASTFSIEE